MDTSRPQDVGFWGFKDLSILSTFWENNLETPHSQDVGFWGSKNIWDMAKIWIFSVRMYKAWVDSKTPYPIGVGFEDL